MPIHPVNLVFANIQPTVLLHGVPLLTVSHSLRLFFLEHQLCDLTRCNGTGKQFLELFIHIKDLPCMIICNINATAGILQNRLQRNIGTGKRIFGDPPSQFALNDPSHIPDKPNIAGLPASCFSVFEKTEIHHDLAVHLQGLKGCSRQMMFFKIMPESLGNR